MVLPIKLSIFLIFLLATQETTASTDDTLGFNKITSCSLDMDYRDASIRAGHTGVLLTLLCSSSPMDISDKIKANSIICDNRQVYTNYITHVKFSDCRLPELPDHLFRYFWALRSIDVSDSMLKRLTPESLQLDESSEQLFSLNASSNRIEIIHSETFPKNGNIKELDLSNNLLDTLNWAAFTNLGRLETVHLNGNQIEQVIGPIAPHSKLTQIYLSKNRIHKISKIFGKIEESLLKLIDLSDNNIPTLYRNDFIQLTNLEILDLSNSHVAQIELDAFAPLNQLTHLDLSKNELVTVNFDMFLPAMQHLSVFKLNGNELSELTNHIDQLFPRLTELAISENQFNCSYLNRFLMTMVRSARAIEVNSNYNTRNMRGIGCIEVDEMKESTTEWGLDDVYKITTFASVLWLALANLVIIAVLSFKRFK